MIKFQNQIDRLSDTSPNIIEKITREGKADGKKNVPASDSKNVNFEEQLSAEMLDNFGKYENDFVNLKKKHDSKIEKNISTIEHKLKQSSDDENRKFDQFISELEKSDGEDSHQYDDIINKISDNEISLRSLKSQLEDRELQTSLVSSYMPFMLLLSFAEVWINRLAFELFFESNPLVSFLLALAVGGVLVFFAHISGTTVKRLSYSKWNKGISLFFLALLNSLTVVVIIYLAKMRQAFVAISTISAEEMTFDDLISDELGDLNGIIANNSAVDNLFSTDIGQEGMFLLLINITIFVCGCIAAFIRHDQHPDYEKLVTENTKLYVKRSKYLDRFQERFAKERKELNKKLENIENQIEKLESENEDLKITITDMQDTLVESKRRLKAAYVSKVKAYRNGNLAERSVAPPDLFDVEPNLGI